jgi:phosphonate metabolism protein PhnN/1,5-bisphosphokinase (PRPP-forming)
MSKRLGHLVLVVGPSGAGKDSVINGAREIFADNNRIVFPRRIVTRKAQVSAEDHDSLNEMAFALAVASGEFAFWWRAHNNGYGIPVSIETDLASGRSVVFNCSRDIIAEAVERYIKTTVVEITAPPDVLVERIVARGRESREDALARVSRSTAPYPRSATVVRINNVGTLEVAVDALCAVIAPSKHARTHPRRRPLNQQNQNKYRNDGGRGLVVVE